MKTLLSFLTSSTGILLGVAIAWQLAMTLIGFALTPGQGALGHMIHWDANWYQHILTHAYSADGSPAAPAFYPLFPLLVSILEAISFGVLSHEVAALLINTTALWLALVALVGIVKHFKLPRSSQYIAVIAFLSFPSAFFMHVFYSEALFIALGFWAYLLALRTKWWAVGVLLGILTAARLPSVLVIALCGLEYLRAHQWSLKKSFNKNLLWFLLAPIGFLAYGTYLAVTRGDFLGMFHAYKATNDWTYQQFNPNIFNTLYETTAHIVTSIGASNLTYEVFINYALPLASLALILISAVYLLRTLKSRGVPLAVFSILSIILFTLNSNVVSVHRYALACLPLFIMAALLARSKRWRYAGIPLFFASFAIQLFIYAKFTMDIFAG